jgi:hypothetical protein
VFSIVLAKPFDEVPAEVRARLRSMLTGIAKSLDAMPRTGAVWKSVTVGGLLLDVTPWRFQYRVDVKAEALVVEKAVLIGSSAPPT